MREKQFHSMYNRIYDELEELIHKKREKVIISPYEIEELDKLTYTNSLRELKKYRIRRITFLENLTNKFGKYLKIEFDVITGDYIFRRKNERTI